jgi:hypothetical protein
MIQAAATPRALFWPIALPRRRVRRAVQRSTARQAVRQGLRASLQTTCLAAAVLAAAGAVGASRGPVVLTDPAQVGSLGTVTWSVPAGAGLPHKVTSR